MPHVGLQRMGGGAVQGEQPGGIHTPQRPGQDLNKLFSVIYKPTDWSFSFKHSILESWD